MVETSTQVAIVGGGITGLALGFHLQRAGVRVRVLEGSARAGGNIRTESIAGFRCEWGPNGFLDNEPATLRLVEALGLGNRLVRSSAASKRRWVVRNGRLRELPKKPPELLRSDVLSARGKLALLLEWTRPRRTDPSDESVFDFATRRIGREAAEVLVDALVTGIYAADSRQLSLAAAFPKMRAMEREHGGLFRAMRAAARARRKPGPGTQPAGGPFGPAATLTSFDTGMEALPSALAAELGTALVLGTPVTGIARAPRGWQVQLAADATIAAEQLVVAVPAWRAAPLLAPLDAGLAAEVGAITGAPIAVVCTGFDLRSVQQVERGFGFLVPAREGIGILGTLFDSWIYARRSAEGQVLWRTLVGGARDPNAPALDDATLVARVREVLGKLLGVDDAPVMTHVVRHPHGIPQYVLGHADRIDRIEKHLGRHPGLHFAGYSYRGISVNACIQEAESLAARLRTTLGTPVVPS